MKYRKQRVIVIFLAIIIIIPTNSNEIDSKAKQETTSILLSKFDWIHRISIEKNDRNTKQEHQENLFSGVLLLYV